MHKDEMWQVYAANGEPVAGEGWSADLDNPEVSGSKVIVAVVAAFLYRYGVNGLEILWQKRSTRVRNAEKYDFASGGHINFGEPAIEAVVRETREEIGVEISPEELRFVTTLKISPNRLLWLYLVDWTGKVEEFHFDDEEVSEVRWVPYGETEEFRKKYAKPSVANGDTIFAAIGDYMKMQGLM